MTLTAHQNEAIEHLRQWRVGALFMEPGTGKTRATLEIIRQCDTDFILWIGPLGTIRTRDGIASISDEIAKWGGVPAPIRFVGAESISASDRIFMETMAEMKAYRNVFCVVDESLKIKNADAKRTRHIIELGNIARYRLILNGTPLCRNIVDMWSQMEFLSPQILNMTHRKFVETFCRTKTITHKVGGVKIWEKTVITGFENLDYLHSLIRHYVYQCDLQLNISQYYRTRHYYLSLEEREAYDEIKERYLDMEMLERRNDNIFMEMTSEMQHSYCTAVDKFRCVDDILKDVDESRVIIFCRFVRSRQECEARYSRARVLSYQKESFGLNLQDYDVTIYFDKIWDYALRLQSSRRTYRTGQEHDCLYYDLTGDVGLERLIDRNIDRKIDMLEYFKKISREELEKEL